MIYDCSFVVMFGELVVNVVLICSCWVACWVAVLPVLCCLFVFGLVFYVGADLPYLVLVVLVSV